ncbi:MAG: hypothetical protein ABMA14_16545 [Hyphomonadaceae bacterium]
MKLTTDAGTQVLLPRFSDHNILNDNAWLPVCGWPLRELGGLAETTNTPSLLVFANRARPQWRQAVYLALATGALNVPAAFAARIGAAIPDDSPADALQTVVRLLPTLSPGKILASCLDETTVGLLGVIKKLDHHPLRPETYRDLVRWHHEPRRDDVRCRALQKMFVLDQGWIDAVEALDPVLMTQPILHFTRTKTDAERLNQVLRVIQKLCSDADYETLQKSARELDGRATIRNWAEGWLRRADRLLPPPFDGDHECRPVLSGPAVHDIAQRFKNCLSNRYMAAILSGKVAVVEYSPGPALALLSRLSGGHWLLVSIHAPGNRPVSDDLAERVRKKIRSFGTHIHVPEEPHSDVEEVMHYIFGGFEPFDLEWLAIEQ